MSNLIQIAKGVVNAMLISDDPAVKAVVQGALSYKVAGAEQTDAFASSRWDGRSNFFEYSTGKFPAGFASLARIALEKAGYQVQISAARPPSPLGPENPKVSPYPYDPRYDYQPEAVRRLLKYGQMIAQIATGGGKSEVANIATARIKRTTLFVTTRGALMYQMQDHFKKALRHRFMSGEKDLVGKKIGVIGDGVWEPSQTITVAMVQTLYQRLTSSDAREREETIAFLRSVEFVILEEAHEAGGNGFYDVMRYCVRAHYRLALTATPFMRDDEEANMRLMAVAGRIGIRVTEKELIDKGILAKPYFRTLSVTYSADTAALSAVRPKGKADLKALGAHSKVGTQLGWSSSYERARNLGITHNAARNALIVREALEGKRYGLPTICLVQSKRHGNLLYWAMSAAGLRVTYIQGADDKDARIDALNKLKTDELDVVIGTKIVDVGVDVPAASLLILAGGGKAEVELRQRIGRVLREKRQVANVALIIDFEDKINKHLYKHYLERAEIIKSTPGFVEQHLPINAPFRYGDFFKLAA